MDPPPSRRRRGPHGVLEWGWGPHSSWPGTKWRVNTREPGFYIPAQRAGIENLAAYTSGGGTLAQPSGLGLRDDSASSQHRPYFKVSQFPNWETLKYGHPRALWPPTGGQGPSYPRGEPPKPPPRTWWFRRWARPNTVLLWGKPELCSGFNQKRTPRSKWTPLGVQATTTAGRTCIPAYVRRECRAGRAQSPCGGSKSRSVGSQRDP